MNPATSGALCGLSTPSNNGPMASSEPVSDPSHEPRVRAMRAEDVERVAAIEREAFSAPWREETFRTLLGRPGAELLVLETDADGVIGYTVMWCIEDQGELANIGIAETHRGRDLGNLLLDYSIALAMERGVTSLYLEVRESNERARHMYERRGFEEIGVRRDYYDDPREDARVLVKRL